MKPRCEHVLNLAAAALLGLALGACDGCDGGEETCATAADCPAGWTCLDGRCVDQGADGDADGDADADADGDADADADGPCPAERDCAGGHACCAAGEECVDGRQCLPVCTGARCGDNHEICCGAEQVCLDGVVCAADCEAALEALCGAGLDVCCPAGDVCLDDACTTPGDACLDDFDCRSSDLYCELTVGRCLPMPGEPLCEIRPAFDRVALETEWHWAGVEIGGVSLHNVTSAPVVGDVSGDGVPDVVVVAYSVAGMSTAALVALSGEGGELLFAIAPGGPDSIATEGVALANLDLDDEALEVVYRLASGGGVRVVDGDGETEIARRDLPALVGARSTIEIADLNADAVPDVVVGCVALDGAGLEDPSLDFFDHGACGDAFGLSAPCVADLDLDGEPEVTSGGVAIEADGSLLWDRGGLHGLSAVADLDLDGTPEVVVVRDATVSVVAGADGAVLIGPGGAWADGTYPIPGGGNGGAPTVADFDADGFPEVGAAGQGAYAVYDPDCLETPPRAGGEPCDATDFLRWEAPTQDLSSSVTGSSVFDFQGDGVAEVVYNDECFLHVYDGRTGEDVLAEPRFNSSRTSFEYPIVVDVDADGNSEIVVVANNDQAVTRDHCPEAYAAVLGVAVSELPPEIAQGTAGVFAFGDPDDRWVLTRPIWNQYSYHVTNVSSAGQVPAIEDDSWTVPGVNSYRQNVQGRGIFNVPDLEVTLEATDACAEASVILSAVVENAGSRGVPPGVTLEFHRVAPDPAGLVAAAVTAGVLLPGGSERVTVTVTDIPFETDLEFEVRVDPAAGVGDPGAVAECDETDNQARATASCDPIG
jgi:hypothetical protein